MTLIYYRISKAVIEGPHYADDVHIAGVNSEKHFTEAFLIEESIVSVCSTVTCSHNIDQYLTCPDAASYYEISEQAFMSLAVIRSVPFRTAEFENCAENKVKCCRYKLALVRRDYGHPAAFIVHAQLQLPAFLQVAESILHFVPVATGAERRLHTEVYRFIDIVLIKKASDCLVFLPVLFGILDTLVDTAAAMFSSRAKLVCI